MQKAHVQKSHFECSELLHNLVVFARLIQVENFGGFNIISVFSGPFPVLSCMLHCAICHGIFIVQKAQGYLVDLSSRIAMNGLKTHEEELKKES